jgi:hypothetical protein
MQQVSLPPKSRRGDRFMIRSAADEFDIRIFLEVIAVRAPTGRPLLIQVLDQRKQRNGPGRERGLEPFGRWTLDSFVRINQERFSKDTVIA